MATPKFNYKYDGLDYKNAEKQVSKQVDPVYNRAVKSVYQQQYQNDVQSGQVAAARGLGRSGLAADAINKNGLAAQGQVGDIQAQRASQIAQMANDLTERDKDRGMQARSQAYSEWLGQQNLSRDDRNFTYQKGRDAVGDTQWNKQFNFQKESYANDKKWREYTYKNMSAAQKSQLEWAKKQYGEDAAWRLYEMEYQGELSKSMSDAEREFYGSLGLGDFLE
jgi:hypothetical protein